MNKNVFEDAYFDKAYKTRDGRKAIFVINMGGHYGHPYRLVIENEDNFFNYDKYGRMAKIEMNSDIISEWHEEINEVELDRLAIKKACEFADTYQEKTGNYGHNEGTLAVGYRYGYYDGYRKAMKGES